VIPILRPGEPFPPLEHALAYPDGLLAAGGDLAPGTLIGAYARGIFPWSAEGQPLLWWSPDPRMVLPLAEFRVRRRLVVDGLNAIPGVSCIEPAGAFYAFPNVTGTGMSARTLQDRLLEEAGVAMLAGTAFGAHGEGFMRVSYANSQENIREALGIMADLLAAG